MERTFISDVEDNSSSKIVTVLLQTIQTEKSQKGSDYVKITFTDGKTNASANKFNCRKEDFTDNGIETDTLVDVTLNRKNGFYNFSSIEPTKSSLSFDEFVKKAPIDIDAEFDYVIKTIRESAIKDAFGEDRYATVTEFILKENKEAYKYGSAAKSMHHNYIGGLLQHSASLVKGAVALCKIYPDLDKELLVCGAALHDIGKLVELDTTPSGNASYTVSGVLLGHLWAGANMVEEVYRNVFHRPIDNNINMLLHMIASHHGKPEYGTIVIPAFKEAYCLHALDMLDSRMQIFTNEYENIEPGCAGSAKAKGLDTVVYHPAPFGS